MLKLFLEVLQLKSRFRWIAVLMTILLSLFIGFSFNSHATQAAKKDSGTLKIGMEANYPPYNLTQPNKTNGAVPIDGSHSYANGYDVQIAKIIGKRYIKKSCRRKDTVGWTPTCFDLRQD